MRNASMKVLKNLVCCAAFICLMFVLAMPAHAASKADELLQLVNAERAQAGVAPLSMGSSALNAAAQARAKELTVNYSYNRPNGSREFTILPEYGVDDVSVGENYWAAAENASDVVAAWNRYDFFKERMLDKDATSVGIGYYEGGEYGNYWVMIFTRWPSEAIQSATTFSGVVSPQAAFSPVAVSDTPYSFSTVKQLVPSGRVWEATFATSFARSSAAACSLASPMARGARFSFARSALTSASTSCAKPFSLVPRA